MDEISVCFYLILYSIEVPTHIIAVFVTTAKTFLTRASYMWMRLAFVFT